MILDTVNVADLGAMGNGTQDVGPFINSAAAQLVSMGGGTVYVPPGGVYRVATPVSLPSNVNLRGSRGGGSRLLLDTGTAWGGIIIGAQAQQTSFSGVSDLYIDHTLAMRGWSIITYFSAWTKLERLYLDKAYNGIAVQRANTTVLRDINVNATQSGSWAGLMYHAEAGVRSDSLTIDNVVLQMGGAGMNGFVWSGMSCDVDARHLVCLGGNGGSGIWTGNFTQSASEFPQYGDFRNCQVDGWNGPAVTINLGSSYRFSGGSYDSINSIDPNVTVFQVNYDPLTVTRSVTLEGVVIATGPGRLASIDAKGTTISSCRIFDGDKALTNTHPALEIGPNSDGALVTGSNIGYGYGQSKTNKYSVQIDRGATRTILNGNNHRLNGGTGTLNDLSGTAVLGAHWVDYLGAVH